MVLVFAVEFLLTSNIMPSDANSLSADRASRAMPILHAAAACMAMRFISHYRGGTKLEERRRANRNSNRHDA